MSLRSAHVRFEPVPKNGSFYDLVLVDDPYGGIIVVWTSAKMTWRYYQGDYMKPLGENCNEYDAKAIFSEIIGQALSESSTVE